MNPCWSENPDLTNLEERLAFLLKKTVLIMQEVACLSEASTDVGFSKATQLRKRQRLVSQAISAGDRHLALQYPPGICSSNTWVLQERKRS